MATATIEHMRPAMLSQLETVQYVCCCNSPELALRSCDTLRGILPCKMSSYDEFLCIFLALILLLLQQKKKNHAEIVCFETFVSRLTWKLWIIFDCTIVLSNLSVLKNQNYSLFRIQFEKQHANSGECKFKSVDLICSKVHFWVRPTQKQ